MQIIYEDTDKWSSDKNRVQSYEFEATSEFDVTDSAIGFITMLIGNSFPTMINALFSSVSLKKDVSFDVVIKKDNLGGG